MFIFKTSTLSVILAALASATALDTRASSSFRAPEGKGNFTLLTLGFNGPAKYSGLFLSAYHIGAGLNAIVGAPQQSQVFPANYAFASEIGDIYNDLYPQNTEPEGNVYFTFDGAYYEDYVFPPGYAFTGLNVGQSANNLSFAADGSNELLKSSYKGKVLSVCPVTFCCGAAGTHATLLWRDEGVIGNETCADVTLKAIF